MRIDILTIFPEICAAYISSGILAKALESGKVNINLHNLRDFSSNLHKTVDDAPFGGGRGMILKPEPIFKAIDAIRQAAGSLGKVILLSPEGEKFSQQKAGELAGFPHLILICGRYEGIDERVRENLIDREISIGDYVLSGGELPALVITDAVARLLPGVLDEEVVKDESFFQGLLDYPQYTRPREFKGFNVPEVLLSGNHKLILDFRRKEALKRTHFKRPDLLACSNLTPKDQEFLQNLNTERGN